MNDLLSANDIEKITYDILKQSKCFDVYPTPVDKIIAFSELYVDTHTGIHSIPNNYISKNVDVLKKALRKVYGALDRRKKIIYLEPDLKIYKQNFIKLHEVGHDVLPWQKKTFEFIDDDQTVHADTEIEYEREANFFASATLFQLDRFEEMVSNLPLELKTTMLLAKKFGSSIHAAIRRYAENSKKRCSLLILDKLPNSTSELKKRNYFKSGFFTKDFGNLELPEVLNTEWPFVQDFFIGKKFHDSGLMTLITDDGDIDFEYHFFNNTYNVFVFILPEGERIKTRTKIYLKGHDVIL
jgi:Zn-dependent peptidase ImmA (M78 family)